LYFVKKKGKRGKRRNKVNDKIRLTVLIVFCKEKGKRGKRRNKVNDKRL